jgi:hypothetical protein
MGSFYVNFAVKRDDSGPVADAMRRAGYKAIVTPPLDGYVVVYEETSDTQDGEAIERVGALLSREAGAPVLAVLNHDDDILCYWLFTDGQVIDSYNSTPDYFDGAGEEDPEAEAELGGKEWPAEGNAQRLCDVLSVPSASEKVEAILREDYGFASHRHADLVDALGLPDHAAGLGYRYVSRGELPAGLDPDQLIRVG